MSKTNLFNTLSDQEQEVVSGGYTFTTSGAWGSVTKVVNGASGSYTYVDPYGTKHVASWSPSGFSYV